ncbi:MAG TPA: hypothetical protein VGR16_12860 [Thermomicrobiales bacterium]|nr:hypothetical protein [Thermomicrobiales bacterium]
MKRAVCAAVLVAALMLTNVVSVAAHTITVDPPGEGSGTSHDLAKGITPKYFDADGNYVGVGGQFSAASQGTSTACLSVPEEGPVSITAGRQTPCPQVP